MVLRGDVGPEWVRYQVRQIHREWVEAEVLEDAGPFSKGAVHWLNLPTWKLCYFPPDEKKTEASPGEPGKAAPEQPKR
jgi:hypothetical protein